ncbi:unnamed protein product [Lactuca saligna]|uniref:Uncharacterized protein n=1 Tax=Lactuca saligna TaxID=75948 RepID=A0AA35VM65_LACSI|nr:unnamed protein product [Lactuca saligna]
MGNIIVIREKWEDFILAATSVEAEISLEMALHGHYRGKLCHREVDLVEGLPPPVSKKRVEAEISLEMALRGHYRGKLCHRKVDLVEALPPPVSEKRMRELAGLLSAEGGNIGSCRPASPS